MTVIIASCSWSKIIFKKKTRYMENEIVRAVFLDRTARNLWLGIKWRHLTSREFDQDCLRIAEQVKLTPPQTAIDLKRIFHSRGHDPVFRNENDCRKLAEALLPYVLNALDFSFDIIEEPVANHR